MRNYIIIGGSSGIGKELVNLLEIEGAKVFSTYNNNVIEDRPNINYIKFDVKKDSLKLEDLPDEIHGLAYCPGSINLKPFHRFTDEDFIEDFKTKEAKEGEVTKEAPKVIEKSARERLKDKGLL